MYVYLHYDISIVLNKSKNILLLLIKAGAAIIFAGSRVNPDTRNVDLDK